VTTWRAWRPAAACALAAGSALAVGVGAPGPVRLALVIPFVLLGPGLALSAALGLTGVLDQIVMTIVASPAVSLLAAEALLLFHHWSPGLGLGLIVAVTVGAAAWSLRATQDGEGEPA
jgi:hypothetical protein